MSGNGNQANEDSIASSARDIDPFLPRQVQLSNAPQPEAVRLSSLTSPFKTIRAKFCGR